MKRAHLTSHLLFIGILLHALSAFCSETTSDNTKINIVNVADDFIAYYKKCFGADAETRAVQWDIMLESKHQEFFSHVLYRKKEGEDRESFKKARITEFWNDIAPKIGKIAKLNSNAESEIKNVLTEFKKQFPGFDPGRDYYITIAFSFKGKVVDVAGKNIFAIGLESFGDDFLQFKITIAHELFHLYHFQYFSASGALYRKVWAEGMAAYASAVIVPGYKESRYLNFSIEKMNQCYDLLPKIAKELRENMGEKNEKLERIYLGAEDNAARIPPEAGYYVGLQIVSSLAKRTPIVELAKLKSEKVYSLVEAELEKLENPGK
jgi:uncharacterized protein YjaZ